MNINCEELEPLLALGRKWLRESAESPIRLAQYGSMDALEHCADELEKSIRGIIEKARKRAED